MESGLSSTNREPLSAAITDLLPRPIIEGMGVKIQHQHERWAKPLYRKGAKSPRKSKPGVHMSFMRF
jgi:hypothetical protein